MIFRLSYIENEILEFNNLQSRKLKKTENIILLTLHKSVEFSRLMLISTLFDQNEKTFSVWNLNNIFNNNDKYFEEEIEKLTPDIKSLITWRGNILAHENLKVLKASHLFPWEFHAEFVFGDTGLIRLQNFLVKLLSRYESNSENPGEHENIYKNIVRELEEGKKIYKSEIDILLGKFKSREHIFLKNKSRFDNF